MRENNKVTAGFLESPGVAVVHRPGIAYANSLVRPVGEGFLVLSIDLRIALIVLTDDYDGERSRLCRHLPGRVNRIRDQRSCGAFMQRTNQPVGEWKIE